MTRLVLYSVIGLAALIAIVVIVGMFLPKGHRASRTMTYRVPPATVFAAISDVQRFPEWRSDLKSVELLSEGGKGMRFRETGKQGTVTYRVEVREADRKLVTRIDDPSLPFGGSWTFEIQPAADGSSLTITEDGEIYNPIFRVMSKLIFSPYATIDTYQADLRKRVS